MRYFCYLGKSVPAEVALMITEVSEETSLLDGAPPCSLREKPLQTGWSWCIRTLMVHAADLSGHWVHSNNTCCVCLHPWDNLMRMYPLSADSGGARRAAGCSCCHQGFNHSPLSAWHTQGTAVSAGTPAALPPHHINIWQLLRFVPRSWLFAQA